MSIPIFSALALTAAVAVSPCARAQTPTEPATDPLPGQANPQRRDPAGLTPPIRGAALRERAEQALAAGFGFLVKRQNRDGSWGSHDPKLSSLKDFGFGTGNRGANDAVRIACTAIIAQALLRKPQRSAAEQHAFDRALDALLRTDKFAYSMGQPFLVWGYGYKLAFLTEFLVTLAPGVIQAAYPSKTITYLRAGTPIVAMVEPDSELGRMITDDELGAVVSPGDSEGLAAAISELAATDREPYRNRCGETYDRLFDRKIILDKWSELLASIESELNQS